MCFIVVVRYHRLSIDLYASELKLWNEKISLYRVNMKSKVFFHLETSNMIIVDELFHLDI